MSIAVFGASGATGRRFVAAASNAGLTLRLHYRSAPPDDPPDLATIVVGALTDPTAVREALRGSDAVVVLLGPRTGSKDIFCAKATRAVVDAMRGQQQTRLLCMGCAALGAMPGNVSMVMRAAAIATRRFRTEEEADDRAEQERIVRSSRLEWTLVKPPRLTDNGRGETVRAGIDLDVGLRSTIARDTVAAFLLAEIETPRFVGQTVYVSGTPRA